MLDFNYYFIEPCELVAIVYQPDGITELGRYSFRGYMRGMDHFFQVCSLLAYEAVHPNRFHDTDFENYLSTIRAFYSAYVKSGESINLESAVQQRIEELKQYKFKAQRIFPFLPDSSATWADRKQFEITIDYIFRKIKKMRQQRILFYERILQEYMAQKDQYNQRLQEYLKNDDKKFVNTAVEFDTNSILSELGIDSENHGNGGLHEKYYEIYSASWYLKDLLNLENPEIERYTKRLPRYRSGKIHTYPEGLKAYFELFSVFKDEMSLILPDEPDKSFFERVLTVLSRDFGDDFEQHGDLEEVIVKHIEELEKYEFLSLPKEQFFDKLSKMIYDLRARRIAFYEAVLADYLANKEKYDNAM